MERIKKRVDVDNHDMGVLYTPSRVAAYRLTGNETAGKAALMAADNLMGRFQEKGQFFQDWGELGAKDNYRLIIGCLLNMPLLFWASAGNPCANRGVDECNTWGDYFYMEALTRLAGDWKPYWY